MTTTHRPTTPTALPAGLAPPARNGAGPETGRVLLGQVTAADSEKGVTVHLRRGQSVEQLRQGQCDWAICLTLFLIGAVLAALLAPLQLDPSDDGLYMYQATSLLHGVLPYRDFAMHDAPLGNLWQAFLLLLFGRDVLVLRLAIIPFKAVLLPLVYLLARPLVPCWPAILGALMVPLMDVSMNYNVPHVGLNALALTLGTLLVLRVWQQQPRLMWLVLAGALIGVATGFKQNIGLYLLAGTGLWLLDTSPYSLRMIAWSGVGGAALWLVRDHFELIGLLTLVLPIAVLLVQVVFSRSITSIDTPIRLAIMRVAAIGCGFLATTLPWLLWYSLQLGLNTLINKLLIEPSRLGMFWFASLSPPPPRFWLFPVLCLGTMAVMILLILFVRKPATAHWITILSWSVLLISVVVLLSSSKLRNIVSNGIVHTQRNVNIWVFWSALLLSLRLPSGATRRHIRLLLITSTMFTLVLYPQMRLPYISWVLPLFLPLAVWVLWEGSHRVTLRLPMQLQAQFRGSLRVALCLLPLLAGYEFLYRQLSQYVNIPKTLQARQVVWLPLVALDLPHVHLLGTPQQAAAYQQILAEITNRTLPNTPIYCFTGRLAVYAMAERPSAVWNVYVPSTLSPSAMGHGDEFTMRAELVRAQVQIVVVDGAVPAGGKLAAMDWQPWAGPIVEYLNANFHPVYSSSYGSVWVYNLSVTLP